MAAYPIILLIVVAFCSSVGFMSTLFRRSQSPAGPAAWLRWISLLILLGLGAMSLLAAVQPRSGFVLLGLAVCGFVMSILWEEPEKPVTRWLPERL